MKTEVVTNYDTQDGQKKNETTKQTLVQVCSSVCCCWGTSLLTKKFAFSFLFNFPHHHLQTVERERKRTKNNQKKSAQ